METPDVSPFSYGILSLTNPYEWPNHEECDGFSHLITGKSIYVWALIFAAYTWNLKNRKGVEFPTELTRIDEYIARHLRTFVQENPVDFSNAGKQYVSAKPGSFQSLRRGFGAPAKRLPISEAEGRLSSELHSLETRGLIVDPFTVGVGGLTLAVMGAVPFSFTQRTKDGDEKYLQIKAMLWEFEYCSDAEKREIRFHFFMEKAIAQLKKHIRLISSD